MFRKILVANRGEIALRVIRACREIGVSSVAVAADPDREAPHARAADEVQFIGGASAADSYLRQDRILEAARRSGAQAIHPGYGFLSENAAFAARCVRAGVTFIGPDPAAMRRLGNKIRARRLARRIGVPVVPGTDGAARLSDARALARRTGFPLLIKAAAGGGGRGLRVVHRARDLEAAFREAASEVRASFGDATLFVERCIQKPRHIEIQILADGAGNVVHLFERDCSVQRRHQKLIEESPAPHLPEETLGAMGEAACRLARAGGYSGAGTVEFLLAPDGTFSFLEVNTRLQVEHPVTEMITGVDLVQEQIRIAAGGRLSAEPVRRRGHAIECRIVAEDPFDGFLPAAGRVVDVRLPTGPGVRVDTMLEPGVEIPPYYDSLVAKLICWAGDRPRAVARARRALGELRVVGVPTSAPFLAWALESEEFARGRVDTGWVERTWKGAATASERERAAVLAAALDFVQTNGAPHARGIPIGAWERGFDEPAD